MKKRVKLLTVLLLVICVGTVSASGAELFSGYPVTWAHYSGGDVYVAWMNYNLTTDKTSRLANNLESAHSYWEAVDVICEESNYYNAKIMHALPTEEWWEANVNQWLGTVYADSEIYDTSGRILTTSSIASSTRIVQASNIYYNPTFNYTNQYTDTNARCLIAHEVGHALGFGHVSTGTGSIMESGTKNFSSLQTYDVNEFYSKYP